MTDLDILDEHIMVFLRTAAIEWVQAHAEARLADPTARARLQSMVRSYQDALVQADIAYGRNDREPLAALKQLKMDAITFLQES